MMELSLYGVQKFMDSTLILDNISFDIFNGEKVGIVGANGSGKSTILKLLAGVYTLDRYDKGRISITNGAKVAYLEQIPNYSENFSVNDILNIAFDEIIALEKEMRLLENDMNKLTGSELEKYLKKYSKLTQKLEIMGGYEREERLNKVCKGLKLEDSFLDKKFGTLSGGEKTTVLLGKILLENPDILLLDEPTNHLDMESIEWLEGYLRNYKGIVVIVSHDRYFLDNVVTKIIEIEDMKCETFKGNYSYYVKQKEENLLLQFQQFKEQQKKIKEMQKAIKDLRDWALRADNNKFIRRAVSLEKRLEKMEMIEKPVFEKQNMRLKFSTGDRSGNEVIKVKDLIKKFQEKAIFCGADLLLEYSERAALIGPNGCGKTTFIKMLLGEETIDNGTIALGANVRTAYLPQHIIFHDEELTVLQCFREDINILEGKAREYLSKFIFFGSDVFKKVKHLSGGEKIRLKLAKLLYEDINLLILDEPTNHLDIDSIENLEAALEDFKGTILFISHDRYFINKISDRIIAIEDKKFANYLGNYDFYLSKREDHKKEIVKVSIEKEGKKDREIKIKQNQTIRKREKEVEILENTAVMLEKEIKEIDETMNSLGSNFEELAKYLSRKEELQIKLDEVLNSWMNLVGDNPL